MGVFQFRVGRKNPSSSELAKERLKVLLVHDRLKLRINFFEWDRTEPCHRVLRLREIVAPHCYLSRTCAPQKRAPIA